VKLKYQGKRLELVDGVKVWLSDSEWIFFRGSGNAPEFRVFTQSKDEKRSQKLGLEGLSFVKHILHGFTRSRAGFVDSLKILETIKQFPNQCQQAIAEAASIDIPSDYTFVTKIVLAGMGGSALGGRIAVSLEKSHLKVPFFVSTEFHLPEFVDTNTLVILSSYSGNTEETLSCLQEALTKKAKIIGIATGGKLADKLRTAKIPLVQISPRHNPSGQPRMGVGYSTMTVLAILARCQLIKPITNSAHLSQFLIDHQSMVQKSTIELAQVVAEKIPVFFAGEHLKGAVHAVKNMINENSKSFSVMFDLPEANHHLLEGLVFPFDDVRDLAFIFIESDMYHSELKKRFALTSQVFARQEIPVLHIKAPGGSELFEAMWTIQWGMYLSYYLAREYKIDPGPIPWVTYLKDQLKY
jgi:glucose/mannose-6-phosphate isomerase